MCCDPDKPIVSFVLDSLERYPRLGIRDVYKLLYQSYLGCEHDVVDRNTAWQSLEREWNRITGRAPDETQPLIEPIYMEGLTPPLYRLHLRPAKEQGISPESILEEFLRTAGEFPRAFPGEEDDLRAAFVAAWGVVGRALQSGELDLAPDAYSEMSSARESEGWPAMHHSEEYREAYDPHYRLVMDPTVAASL